MNELWQSWKGGLVEASLIIAAVATVTSFFEDGRKKLKKAGWGMLWAGKMALLVVFSPVIAPVYLMWRAKEDKKERSEFRDLVEGALKEARDDRADIRGKVEEVQRDLVFNGGSTIRDMMALVESDRQESFWLQRCPAFECLPDGSNILVSEPYLVLTAVRVDDELGQMDWGQFIFAEDLPGYLSAWREAAALGSVFRARARWTSKLRENRGMWEVLATPIKASGTVVHSRGSICLASDAKIQRKILRYRGRLMPVDDVARKIAEDEGWSWPGV